MVLAPKGDPYRYLQLAIRNAKILFVLCLLGACFSAASAHWLSELKASNPSAQAAKNAGMGLLIGIGMVWFAMSLLYMVCAVFLNKLRSWAVTLSIVIASIHLALMIFSALFNIWNNSVFLFWLSIIWVMALTQFLSHLSKTYKAIRNRLAPAPPEDLGGFDFL